MGYFFLYFKKIFLLGRCKPVSLLWTNLYFSCIILPATACTLIFHHILCRKSAQISYMNCVVLFSLNKLDCHHDAYDEYSRDDFSFRNRPITQGGDSLQKDGPSLSKLGSNSTAELHPKMGVDGDAKPTAMPPASVMTRLILIMVWRKLIRNPNTYSSLLGVIWSLISFRLYITSSGYL